MKVTSSVLALASIAVGVQAQGVATGIAPAGGSPGGCLTTGTGKYQVQNVKPPGTSERRDLESRAVDCSDPTALTVQINNGILTDSQGRIGAIVANRQFQFDGPPAQMGSIYTGGWSVCSNGSLAIGPSTVFYQCLSGSFYNIYDQAVRTDCIQIHQQLLECAGNTGTGSSASVSAAAPVSSSSAAAVASSSASSVTKAVSQVSDGQPQATSAARVTQITDGQPQATAASNASVTSARPPVVTGGAAQFVASGAVVAVGAVAAFFM